MSVAEESREACQAVLDEYEEAPTEYVKGGLDTMYAVLLAWPDRIQAELDKKDAEIAALKADARALVDQLDAVHDDPSYMTLFVEAHMRGRPYEGLKYEDELTALKERLGEYSG